jgi:hypothetical protein
MQLSCDRNLPCQRCIRSGRPEQCSFETGTGPPIVSNNQFTQQQVQRNSNEIQHLRAEVAQLRALLEKARLQPEAEALRVADNAEFGQQAVLKGSSPANVTNTDPSDPRERSPRGYYSQHSLFQFFGEVRCRTVLRWSILLICRDRFHNSSRSSEKPLMNGSNLSESILKRTSFRKIMQNQMLTFRKRAHWRICFRPKTTQTP